jgi:FAD/FMN-containing dehydrogenase
LGEFGEGLMKRKNSELVSVASAGVRGQLGRREFVLGSMSGLALAACSSEDESIWDKLSRRVGGRLVKPTSPVKPCLESPASPACTQTLEDRYNPFRNEDEPGAVQYNGYFEGWDPAVSPYAIVAASAKDVAEGIKFAGEHQVPLVVKGTGHDFLGRSSRTEALLIWTHEMRSLEFESAFRPVGAPEETEPVAVVHCGPGLTWLDVYQAATERDLYVQGGSATSVGLGGFLLGAGYGLFSKRFGNAAANLVEAEIVVANGSVIIANEHQNSDLFFALKGGGGGSFGIVTRFTVLTFAPPKTVGNLVQNLSAETDGAYQLALEKYLLIMGTAYNTPTYSLTMHARPGRTASTSVNYLDTTADEVLAAVKDFQEWVDEQSDVEFTNTHVYEMDFKYFWNGQYLATHYPELVTIDPENPNLWWYTDPEASVNYYIDSMQSRWVPARLFEPEHIGELAAALIETSAKGLIEIVTYKGMAGADAATAARNATLSTNPAALASPALVLFARVQPGVYPGIPGHSPDKQKSAQSSTEARAAIDVFRELMPETGAYFNESSYHEPNPNQAFWGSNYERLLEVKKRYDPNNLFKVHLGVGSDS